MSDCERIAHDKFATGERIAQVAHDRRATLSNSLKALMIKEKNKQITRFLERIAYLLFCSQKLNNLLKKIWINCIFMYVFCKIQKRYERIAQVAHDKNERPLESLRSLSKNERMSKSLIYLSESLISSFFSKKKLIRSENWWANSQPW